MSTEVPVIDGVVDLTVIGRGGSATVYRGHQSHLGRWVAVKVLDQALTDAAAAELFRSECRALGRLDGHPHVLRIFQANVLADQRPYLISELCDTSLGELIVQRGPQNAEYVVAIGLQAATALQAAHEADIEHGDLTPANILLRSTGVAVLADFGLSRHAHADHSLDGLTAEHAAPETVSHGQRGAAADVYGLGSTLHTALSGMPPRESALPPGTPEPLAALLAEMLDADPARRPAAGRVIQRLTELRMAGEQTTTMRNYGYPFGWVEATCGGMTGRKDPW